jgi:hypothetical protein
MAGGSSSGSVRKKRKKGKKGKQPAMVEIRHPRGAVILKLPARCTKETVMQHAAEYAARVAASRRSAYQRVMLAEPFHKKAVEIEHKANEADTVARLIREAFGIEPGQIVLR